MSSRLDTSNNVTPGAPGSPPAGVFADLARNVRRAGRWWMGKRAEKKEPPPAQEMKETSVSKPEVVKEVLSPSPQLLVPNDTHKPESLDSPRPSSPPPGEQSDPDEGYGTVVEAETKSADHPAEASDPTSVPFSEYEGPSRTPEGFEVRKVRTPSYEGLNEIAARTELPPSPTHDSEAGSCRASVQEVYPEPSHDLEDEAENVSIKLAKDLSTEPPNNASVEPAKEEQPDTTADEVPCPLEVEHLEEPVPEAAVPEAVESQNRSCPDSTASKGESYGFRKESWQEDDGTPDPSTDQSFRTAQTVTPLLGVVDNIPQPIMEEPPSVAEISEKMEQPSAGDHQRDRTVKVIVLGAPHTGKSTLVDWVCGEPPDAIRSRTTSAQHRETKIIVGDVTVNLQLWDTPQDDEFNSGAPYNEAEGYVVLYDIDSYSSWRRAEHLINRIWEDVRPGSLIALAANKLETPLGESLSDVLRDNGQEFADENDCLFFEIDTNVDSARAPFSTIVELVLEGDDSSNSGDEPSSPSNVLEDPRLSKNARRGAKRRTTQESEKASTTEAETQLPVVDQAGANEQAHALSRSARKRAKKRAEREALNAAMKRVSMSAGTGNVPTSVDAQTTPVKIVVVGPSHSGKTSLIRQLSPEPKPVLKEQLPGAHDCWKKELVSGKDKFDFEMWDCPGGSSLLAVSEQHQSTTNAFIVVYDVNDESTLRKAKGWIDAFRSVFGYGILIALIGTKLDRCGNERGIVPLTRNSAIDYAKENGILLFETSSQEKQLDASRHIFNQIARILACRTPPTLSFDKPSKAEKKRMKSEARTTLEAAQVQAGAGDLCSLTPSTSPTGENGTEAGREGQGASSERNGYNIPPHVEKQASTSSAGTGNGYYTSASAMKEALLFAEAAAGNLKDGRPQGPSGGTYATATYASEESLKGMGTESTASPRIYRQQSQQMPLPSFPSFTGSRMYLSHEEKFSRELGDFQVRQADVLMALEKFEALQHSGKATPRAVLDAWLDLEQAHKKAVLPRTPLWLFGFEQVAPS